MASKMRAGLRAGVEAMKAKKGSCDVTLVCLTCGKQFTIPGYLSKTRKYCCQECVPASNAYKGLHAANNANLARKADQRERIKNSIIEWGRSHLDEVLTCPLNKVGTVYEPLRQYIEEEYGIKDFRPMVYAVIGKYGNKEFAKYMMDVCNDENICRAGLN